MDLTELQAIDADGHVYEPESMWLEHLPPEFHALAPRNHYDSQGRRCHSLAGRTWLYPPSDPAAMRPSPGGWDPKARLDDMDLEGIDQAVLFPTTGLFFAAVRQPDVALALARAYNNWLVEYCEPDRSRLVHVGVLPQADERDTVAEARRCVHELGSAALMMRPNLVDGRTLEDPSHEVLWSAIEELGVPIVMHEGTTLDVVQSGDRFDNFAFRHACSHPHEQQFALVSLLCGGVLERHPGMRVVIVEAGCGWLPSWLERLDEHMEKWAHATVPLPLTPTEYFARQCFITAEPDERTLPSAIDLVGDDVIMWASDYPHPDGIFPGAATTLAERSDISDSSKRKILHENARRCFGLDRSPARS